ncbi:uncharacterized protein [Linepithema humile]|uniref:uncharacterized protein n=1 Tax=Linepithema humile TaxID=83485 RepID=UPI00062339B9|nr:PREDICTED: uncharacterized protein LOC105668338 [Linepithema humile]
MLDDSKSSSSDEKFTENSVNEDSHSRNDIQTAISQDVQHANILEGKSILISIKKHEKDHLLTKETQEIEKCNNDNKDIGEETQNNSEEENACMCVEETCQTLKEVVGSAGKSAKKPKRPKEKRRKFSFLDSIISMCLVGPLAISVWRGIWTWLDLHAELFPGWICFIFGTVLHITFTIYKYRLCYIVTKKWAALNWQKRVLYRALCVLYIYMFGVSCITQWRGGWIIIDDYFSVHVWITPCATCLLLICLAILRGIRNLLATPMILFIDIPSYVFIFPTRYNVQSSCP